MKRLAISSTTLPILLHPNCTKQMQVLRWESLVYWGRLEMKLSAGCGVSSVLAAESKIQNQATSP